MRLYWEVARVMARRLRAYRAATFAGVVTNTVFGYLRAVCRWLVGGGMGGVNTRNFIGVTNSA